VNTDTTNQRLAEAVFRVESMVNDITEIKGAIKELAVAVSRLAVIEERQLQDRADVARVFKRLDGQEVRINTLELAQPLQKQATDWFNKLVLVILVAVVTAGLSFVLMRKNEEIRFAGAPYTNQQVQPAPLPQPR
jgi:hypothetical protein